MYELGVVLSFLYFSPCGKYLVTNRGTLHLFLDTLNDLPTLPLTFASIEWIKEDGEELLSIPRDCQRSLLFVAKNMVLFVTHSGHSTVLQLGHPTRPKKNSR